MNSQVNIDWVIKRMQESKGSSPFSSGTESMMWLSNNCEDCVRSWETRNRKQAPDFDLTVGLVKEGKECIGKFALDFGMGIGVIPDDIARAIGGKPQRYKNGYYSSCLPSNCKHQSNDDLDNPDLNPIEPIAPNQIKMPFDLFEWLDNLDELVITKKAIYELV